MMRHLGYQGHFQQFGFSKFERSLELLEINEARNLHNFLNRFKHITFTEYQLVDIQHLPYKNNSFDCIIHSNTLEHVKDSQIALK